MTLDLDLDLDMDSTKDVGQIWVHCVHPASPPQFTLITFHNPFNYDFLDLEHDLDLDLGYLKTSALGVIAYVRLLLLYSSFHSP